MRVPACRRHGAGGASAVGGYAAVEEGVVAGDVRVRVGRRDAEKRGNAADMGLRDLGNYLGTHVRILRLKDIGRYDSINCMSITYDRISIHDNLGNNLGSIRGMSLSLRHGRNP